MGLLVAAAVAFVVASSVKAKTGAQRLAPVTPGGARADVLPRGQHWEPGCWEPDGQGAHARMRLADGARLAEGAAFVESAKSIIGVLQQYPIAGGESCIGEMSGLVRRLQPLVGRDDAAARTERVLLERRMESAWARVKNDTLRLSA